MTKKTKKRSKQKQKTSEGIKLGPKKQAKLDKVEGYLNALTNIIKIIRG